MKKLIVKPGFEFVFALSLIAILGLPPMLMAQTQKDIEIKIENGDTTINGKNIKELTGKDKDEALKDINHINGPMIVRDGTGNDHRRHIERMDIRRRGPGDIGQPPMVIKDSLGNVIETKHGGPMSVQRDYVFNERIHGEEPDNNGFKNRRFDRPFMGMHRERKNSQNFDYSNTDKDGISTHISYHVTEASNDDLKRMPHVEGPKFEVNDLNLVPEFSSGKTLLLFNLPAKAIADVKLTDSEGKIIFSEKANGGNFSKTFSLGLNGIYYLQIKQGNNIAVKRIMKEE